jgi:hypothetical protein
MTKEKALTRLRGLWFKYQVSHLAILEGVDMMGDAVDEARGEYFGYKRALLDLGLITYNDAWTVEEDKLVLKEKTA